MTIEFQCECGRTLRIPDEYAGKRANCPACQRGLTIPEVASTPESSIDSHGIGEEGSLEEQHEEMPEREAFSEESEPRQGGITVEEILLDREQESQEKEKGWFRSLRVLGLVSGLVVLLVAAIVFTVMRQKEEVPQEVVIFRAEESQDTMVLPVEAEPKEETSQVEETTPIIESLPIKQESTEEVVVEAPAVEGKEAAQEEAEQKVASLEREAESIEEPAPLAGSYTINVGSFREKKRADRFVQELRKKGLEAFWWEVDLPKKGKWYRVSIGNFPTRKDAKDFVTQKKLKDHFGLFITRIPGA